MYPNSWKNGVKTGSVFHPSKAALVHVSNAMPTGSDPESVLC